MVSIGVAINTLNEERNLGYALRSVRSWVDDIVVVDMDSEDKTLDVARAFGARVLRHDRVGFADPARALAVDEVRGDWVLILDADEVVPPPLARHLQEIAAQDRADVVHIPYQNYFLGAPLRYTFVGLFNDKHARFFKRGALSTSGRIHRYVRPEPGARQMTLPRRPELAMQHFGYLDLEHFAEKIDRYTTIEARQMLERGERAGTFRTLRATVGEFLTHFVKYGGILDGWRGFSYSAFMAYYYASKFSKLRALREVGDREAIREHYAEIAERWLAGYEGAEPDPPT
ncbi:MAG: glycosyltransferase family 2 protein [Deinococcales bacterium]|jgi:glycosyltransferase involved in cell wall biosynthesis